MRNKAGALYFGTASNMYLCRSRAVSSPSTRIVFHISRQSKLHSTLYQSGLSVILVNISINCDLFAGRNLRLSPTPWVNIYTCKKINEGFTLFCYSYKQQAASQADKRISGLNDCPKECLCSRSIKADYKVCVRVNFVLKIMSTLLIYVP